MERILSSSVACFVVAVVATSVSAQDAPDPATARVIEQLVQQFSDDDWKTRKRAQDNVVEFGDQATPALRQVLDSTRDPEVRTRAESAIKQIKIDRATGPSRLTLRLGDVPLATAFETIAGASHCNFVSYPANLLTPRTLGPAGLEATRKPFWDVVLPLCKSSGIWFMDMHGTGGKTLHLIESDADTLDSPAFVSGAFLVMADSISRTHALQLARPADVDRSFTAYLRVYPEPKLKVLRGLHQAILEVAQDDRGNSLLPTEEVDSESIDEMSGHGGWPWDLYINLKDVDFTGKRLSKLKGKTRYVVQAKGESVKFTSVLKSVGKSLDVAGARVLLESVSKDDEQTGTFQFRLNFEQHKMPRDVWDQLVSCQLTQAFTLSDAVGRALPLEHSSVDFAGDKLNYHLSFSAENPHVEDRHQPGNPVTLMIEVPTEVRTVEVPFEFNDLPIP